MWNLNNVKNKSYIFYDTYFNIYVQLYKIINITIIHVFYKNYKDFCIFEYRLVV
jgi:hypothetical protein